MSHAENQEDIIPSKENVKCKGPEAGKKLLLSSKNKKEAGEAIPGEQTGEWREIRSEWRQGWIVWLSVFILARRDKNIILNL